MSLLRKCWLPLLILAAALVGVTIANATGVTQTNQLGQNYVLNSAGTPNWARGILTGITLTINSTDVQDPRGKFTATKVVYDGSGAAGGRRGDLVGSNLTGFTGVKLTDSVWIRTATSTHVIRLTVSGIGPTNCTVSPVWKRCTATVVFPDNTSPGMTVEDGAGLNGAETFYLWHPQIVRGTSPGADNPTFGTAINTTFVPKGVTQTNQLGQNLLLQSGAIGASPWSLLGSGAYGVNSSTAPNGTMTATALISTTTTSATHVAAQTEPALTVTPLGAPFSVSVYAKAGDVSWVGLIADGTFDDRTFGLSGSGIIGVSTNQNTVPVTSKIVNVGNGWYRISLTSIRAHASATVRIYSLNGNVTVTTAYAATSTSNAQVYVWGAQYDRGKNYPDAYTRTLTAAVNSTYVPKGATKSSQLGQNLLTFSEQFDNAAWFLSGATITPNTTMAPNGTMTADTLTLTTNAGLVQAFNSFQTNGNVVNFSFYVKPGTLSTAKIGPNNSASLVTFNLLTGTSTQTGSPVINFGSQAIGNGWSRIWVSTLATLASGARLLGPGNSTGTLFVWGAQDVKGTKPGAYVKTTSAAVNQNYVP